MEKRGWIMAKKKMSELRQARLIRRMIGRTKVRLQKTLLCLPGDQRTNLHLLGKSIRELEEAEEMWKEAEKVLSQPRPRVEVPLVPNPFAIPIPKGK